MSSVRHLFGGVAKMRFETYTLILLSFLVVSSTGAFGFDYGFLTEFVGFVTGTVFGKARLPEWGMTVPDVIKYHGYPVENHTLTTEDGYILEIQRIPFGKKGPESTPRRPVLLLHGLWFSSIVWVWNTPDKNLAYILAEAGYDVWLANVRGNEYGLRHTKFSRSNRKFWRFSWDEMALIDLPAIIDLVLAKTGYDQTTLIGHSMGTSMAFALLSTKPEYNKKVKGFAAMGPGVNLGNMKSPLKLLGPLNRVGSELLSDMNHGEFDFNSGVTNLLTTTICANPVASLIACTTAVFAIFGVDYPQLNQSRLSYFMNAYPSTTSVRTVQHFAQMVQSDKFCRFDFGTWRNLLTYHQTTPPEYDITNVTVPVAIFWSDNDWLATPKDVAKIPPKLPNLVVNHRVDYTALTHPDFVWAIHAKSLVYDHVLDAMNKF